MSKIILLWILSPTRFKGLICPCMEYCSHIWGGSSSSYLLDRIESKVIRLVNSTNVTSKLELCRIVGSLSLFYRYYFGFCSQELAACVPPPLARSRNTGQATTSHDYCVAIGNSRVGRYDVCFFPSTAKLWNSFPSHVFPNTYEFPIFKKQIYYFLKNSSTILFFLTFLSMQLFYLRLGLDEDDLVRDWSLQHKKKEGTAHRMMGLRQSLRDPHSLMIVGKLLGNLPGSDCGSVCRVFTVIFPSTSSPIIKYIITNLSFFLKSTIKFCFQGTHPSME